MLWNAFLLALREIQRNTMRSFLTILGVVIGVGAVITMVTVGRGATLQVSEQISSLGTNLLVINPGQMPGPGRGPTSAAPFEIDDVKAVVREIGSLTAVAPFIAQSVTAIYGNQSWSTTVAGTTNEYFDARNWHVSSGRHFAEDELRAGKAVCLLGDKVRKELFSGQDPLGSKIRLKKFSCQVIGVLESKGRATMGPDQDDLVIIPLRTFQRRVAGNEYVGIIHAWVEEGVSTDKVERDIEALLRERRHILPTEQDDFSVVDMKEITKTLTGTTTILTTLLGAVAAVSLFVGGIGIMDIMLVSVTERTREIGIRLAIGALEREVLQQFLVEAIVLSSLGGLFGMMLGLAASVVLGHIMNVPFVFDLKIVITAFLVSAAVGIIFGYFPARQAARLDPIEALRHE